MSLVRFGRLGPVTMPVARKNLAFDAKYLGSIDGGVVRAELCDSDVDDAPRLRRSPMHEQGLGQRCPAMRNEDKMAIIQQPIETSPESVGVVVPVSAVAIQDAFQRATDVLVNQPPPLAKGKAISRSRARVSANRAEMLMEMSTTSHISLFEWSQRRWVSRSDANLARTGAK